MVFGEGISASDLRFAFELVRGSDYATGYYFDADLLGVRVQVGEGDSLLLVGGLGIDTGGMTHFQFADGSTLTMADVLAGMRTGGDGAQYIVGTVGSDSLRGGKGDDVLMGNAPLNA